MHLIRLLVLFLPYACLCMQADAQERYWQQHLKYTIDVTLNDREHTLDGFLTLNYKNNSPDTLTYIWFHVWPSAFKNDRTGFSEQQLQNGKTAFYFSSQEQKGYLNRLDFRSGDNSLEMEDHPLYIDAIKVILSGPLFPGGETVITTPFHVKLPYNFSRGGHNGTNGQSYQLTQWYPMPAVYDSKGWHPMPYLDQGGFYSEFGSFDVKITLPKNYVVAATGELQNQEEIDWLKTRSSAPVQKLIITPKKKDIFKKAKVVTPAIVSDAQNKTLRYAQNNINDFAIFADKYFIVSSGNIELSSGKTITAFSFYHEATNKSINEAWKKSVGYIRSAILYRSGQLGEYPYNNISLVEADFGIDGSSQDYPTIANIGQIKNHKELNKAIENAVGHNWFHGIIGTNKRDHPWLDEGLNTFYNNRYSEQSDKSNAGHNGTYRHHLMKGHIAPLALRQIEIDKTDQPIETASAQFTLLNYNLIPNQKASEWLKMIEVELGEVAFNKAMKSYYEDWKFKHPSPDDFRASLEKSAGKDFSAYFNLLNKTGPMETQTKKKKIVPVFIYSPNLTDSIRHINFTPVPGYNVTDGLMLGAAIHNYSVPISRFRFIAAPLYATKSKQLNGIGNLSYSAYTNGLLQDLQFGLGFARFSILRGSDSNNNRINAGFIKFTPSVKAIFKNASLRSTVSKWLEWKTFIIGESGFQYSQKLSDGNYYPEKTDIQYRYINQLTFNIADYRVLYPYDASLQLQQANNFYRVNLNADYFFNYAKGGGMNIRLFAAKFGYVGADAASKVFETQIYQPKLTAVRGSEDYTYSNYFIGRQESDGIASQQIMMRDGGLKIRTDLFQDLQGRSDNWVASMNFNTSIPKAILPPVIPLKIFFDIGTYAEAWDKEATGNRFLYVGGLQLSLFKDLLNIYAPLIYSKTFRDNLKTVPEENKFFRKISFSIDVHRFNHKKVFGSKLVF
ncbi:MAG TPA: M1 family metallopeptidase [Flavitalea sp.]|nr:M1 family metallopeptidase [Flavitalea sp.]